MEHSNSKYEPARLTDCPNRAATCGLCRPFKKEDATPARWFFYEARAKGYPSFNALPLCARHGILMWADAWAQGDAVLVNGEPTELPSVFNEKY